MILQTSVRSQPRAHIVSTILCNPHTEVKLGGGGGFTAFCYVVVCHLYDLHYGCCASTLIVKNCIIIIVNQCYNGYSSLAVIFYWLFRNHVQKLELGVKGGRKEWMHVKLKPLADGKFVLHGYDPQVVGFLAYHSSIIWLQILGTMDLNHFLLENSRSRDVKLFFFGAHS